MRSDREISFVNFIFTIQPRHNLPLRSFCRYPFALSFVRVVDERRGSVFIATRWWMPQCPPRGEKQHGLHRGIWHIPRGLCWKARFTRFHISLPFVLSPRVLLQREHRNAPDLFALHFARFSSRKSASVPAVPQHSLRFLDVAKICMRFVSKCSMVI